VLVLASLINGIKFVAHQDPDFSSALNHFNLNTFEGVNLAEIGGGAFDVALGLQERLDPSIGTMEAEYRVYTREERERSWLDGEIDKIKTPVALNNCQDDINFKQAQTANRTLEGLICPVVRI